MKVIKFKKLHPDCNIPTKATTKAACFDVTAVEIIDKGPNKKYCRLGFSCQLPEGYKLELVPRSSLTKTNWIMTNSPGQGDEDYEHEYQIRFTAIPTGAQVKGTSYIQIDEDNEGVVGPQSLELELTYDEFPYKVGERIGQVFLSKVEETKWEETDTISTNSNRTGGFGSTGK